MTDEDNDVGTTDERKRKVVIFLHVKNQNTPRVTQVQQDNEVPVLRGACGILDELCLCQIGETRSFTPSEGKSMNIFFFLCGRFHSWQQFNNLSWKNETSNSCICLFYIFIFDWFNSTQISSRLLCVLSIEYFPKTFYI